MRPNKLFVLAILTLAVTLVAGCRTAAIYNVHGASITAPQEKPLTSEEIKGAIIRAGNGLGWKMIPDRDGHILGTLLLRSHAAVVDIDYTPSAYSITYKDSTDLDYDGKNIHNNYNGWIQNLEKAINAQIASERY